MMRRSVYRSWVVALACGAWLTLAACSPGGPSPMPGSPLDQSVPQASDSARTFCLDPPGSGLRAFTDTSGHRRMLVSVLDVRDRPHGDPWACT